MGKAETSILSVNYPTGGLRFDPTHIPLSDLMAEFDVHNNPSKPEPVLLSDDSDSETQAVSYKIPSSEKAMFIISDLVWAKVKNHPWWPGLIIDSSDASSLAMKYHKKDAHLVAFFGDKTFAWCEDSQLKPFLENFSEFKNGSGSEGFSKAVESVLREVSRRFEIGTICPCLNRKLLIKAVYQNIENSGVKEGFSNYSVERGEIVNYFNPKGLVGFVRTLALVPCEESFDRLGLVMTRAQINAFHVFYQTMNNYSSPIKDLTVSSSIKKRTRASVVKIEGTNTVIINKNGSKSNNRPENSLNVKKPDSDSLTPKRQKIILEEKQSDERDLTGLQLIFSTKSGLVPTEKELVRVFSRYGSLKGEMERKIEASECRIKIGFKKRADAKMAFVSLAKEKFFGPALISYRLVGVNEMERKSKVSNGEEGKNLENISGTNEANVQSISVSTTVQDVEMETFDDLPSNPQHDDDSLLNPNPNPNPNPNAESNIQVGDDTLVDPNPNAESNIQSDDTLVNPNPNPNPSPKPNSSSTVHDAETLVNPNPNPNAESTIQVDDALVNPNPNAASNIQCNDTLVNPDPGPNPNPNPNPNPSLKPHSSSTIHATETLVNPNPKPNPDPNPSPDRNPPNNIQAGDTSINPNPNSNPSSTSDALVNPNPKSNPNPNSNASSTSDALVNPNPESNPNPKESLSIKSCNSVLPSFWQAIEKLEEVFTRIPQKPHFMKLQSPCPELRDSQAIALMMAYATLVDSLTRLSLDADVAVFEAKLSGLDELALNGFNVEPIRIHLTKLIEIKTEKIACDTNRPELERELDEIEKEEGNCQLAVEELNLELKDCTERNKELKEVEEKLMAKKNELELVGESEREEISRIEGKICDIDKSVKLAREKFESLFADW